MSITPPFQTVRAYDRPDKVKLLIEALSRP